MTGGTRKGAGRPPLYPNGFTSRTLSLDRRADVVIAVYAKKHGLSRSQAASQLILKGVQE